MPPMRKKADLPIKTCPVCGRSFAWRKKWRKNWEKVVYRLLDYGLRRYIGESASFVNGAIYVLFVSFIPYGIVGTWRLKSLQMKRGWDRLLSLFNK